MEDVTRMEVPTARLKLRPELVGRWSPVGVGGDVGEGGGGVNNIKNFDSHILHLVGRDGLQARSLGLCVLSSMLKIEILDCCAQV